MAPANDPIPELGLSASTELERLVASFEGAWQRGERPSIDGYLPADGVARRGVLIELVHADLERALKAGAAVRVEDYLQRYPELAGDADVVLSLLAAEYDFRKRRDPQLTLEDYAARCPPF